MFTLGLIILCIFLIIENDNKSRQITKLYNELNKQNIQTYTPKTKIEKAKSNIQIPKNKPNKTEINNNLILVVGSILIILSAIVFLSTTWNTTQNILKTIIITLMLVMFKSVEQIANKKLNLPKTAKAFRYISFAYFPIVLLSIPYFQILGYYFSFQGEGINIYLSIASLITTTIYYIDSQKNNDKITEIASLIFSNILVICISSIFSNKLETHITSLLIYSLIFNIMQIKNIKIYKNNYSLYISSIVTILAIYEDIYSIMKSSIYFIQNISNILLFINTYLLLTKIINRKNIWNIVYPVLTVFIFFNASIIFQAFDITKIYMITSILILYSYNLIMKNKAKDETTITSLAVIFVLLILSIINQETNTYILSALETTLLYISYKETKIKKELSYIITTTLFLTILLIISNLNLDASLFGIFSIAISLLSLKNTKFQKPFRQISDIAFGYFIIIYYQNHLIALLLLISYIISVGTYYLKTDNIKYKILSYIYINPIIMEIMYLLNIQNILLLLPISATIIFLLETFISEKDIDKDILLTENIISIITINILNHTLQNLIILIILNLTYILYIKKKDIKEEYLYPTLLSFLPYIVTNNIYIFNYKIMYSISLFLISSSLLMTINRKNNTYDIMFYIYAITHCTIFESNIYVKLALLIIGTSIIYIKKEKEIFKAILYILTFILFKNIFKDLNISHISLFDKGIYLIYISLINRTILKKHTKDYKVLIYIGYIAVNLLALSNYYTEYDGILFNMLLTVIIIISYTKKYGPEFITSLLFVLINTLLLTRYFWLNIPWWIYILLIGSILVAFATNNEIRENKTNYTEKIDKLKRHLDM